MSMPRWVRLVDMLMILYSYGLLQDDPYVDFPGEEFEYPLVDWKAICSLIQKGAPSFQESSHW